MANAFLRKSVTSGNARTDVLSAVVGANTEVVCIGILASNKDSSARTVTLEIKYDNGVDAATYTSLATNIPLPVGSTVSLLDTSKLVLGENENLTVTADAASAVDLHLSYLEIT